MTETKPPPKIAFLGRSQALRTKAARYCWYKYKFEYRQMSDELNKWLRTLEGKGHRKFRPKVKWEWSLKHYDALHAVNPDLFANRIVYLASLPIIYGTVVPDIRYLNEAKIMEEGGFVFIRINDTTTKYSKALGAGNVGPGALGYYEWYSRDVEHVMHAQYSINYTNNKALYKELDRILNDLTDGNLYSYDRTHTFNNKYPVLHE